MHKIHTAVWLLEDFMFFSEACDSFAAAEILQSFKACTGVRGLVRVSVRRLDFHYFLNQSQLGGFESISKPSSAPSPKKAA